MKYLKYVFPVCLLLLGTLLSACGNTLPADDETLHIAVTTYPIYLLTESVVGDTENVSLDLVIDQEVSCLHNYTLTMNDMKAVEKADILLINGAGLEDFLEDALEDAEVYECCGGIDLLWNEDEQEYDPHIWMDPANAAVMVSNIGEALAEADPTHADQYRSNAASAAEELTEFKFEMLASLDGLHPQIITFHDGFSYFCAAFDIDLLASVEEEEGSEASAKTIKEIVSYVQEYDLPAIYTETNGSDATALAICRECGIQTYPLSMCMSGDGGGIAAYEDVIRSNIDLILEAYQ